MGAFACASAEKTKNFEGRAGEGHDLVFLISLVILWHNCLGTYQPIFPFWAVWVSVTQRHPKCRLEEEGGKLRSGSWSQRHIWTKTFFPMSVVFFTCTKQLWSLKNWEYIGDHNFNRMCAQLLDFVVCDWWYMEGGSLKMCVRPSG